MKRIYIAVLLLIAILGTASYSLFKIHSFKEEAVTILNEVKYKAESGSIEDATALACEFQQLWKITEKSMIRYVRHEPLDRIAGLAARLPYLGKYEDVSQLLAQTSELISAVENLWDNELPVLRNLL